MSHRGFPHQPGREANKRPTTASYNRETGLVTLTVPEEAIYTIVHDERAMRDVFEEGIRVVKDQRLKLQQSLQSADKLKGHMPNLEMSEQERSSQKPHRVKQQEQAAFSEIQGRSSCGLTPNKAPKKEEGAAGQSLQTPFHQLPVYSPEDILSPSNSVSGPQNLQPIGFIQQYVPIYPNPYVQVPQTPTQVERTAPRPIQQSKLNSELSHQPGTYVYRYSQLQKLLFNASQNSEQKFPSITQSPPNKLKKYEFKSERYAGRNRFLQYSPSQSQIIAQNVQNNLQVQMVQIPQQNYTSLDSLLERFTKPKKRPAIQQNAWTKELSKLNLAHMKFPSDKVYSLDSFMGTIKEVEVEEETEESANSKDSSNENHVQEEGKEVKPFETLGPPDDEAADPTVKKCDEENEKSDKGEEKDENEEGEEKDESEEEGQEGEECKISENILRK